MKKDELEKLKNFTILCVEDEDGIRESLVNTLKYFVKDVYEAKDGMQGYECYKKYSPDIIMSDILMPKMNGLDMVRKIRQNDQKTCIVLVTAHADQEYLLSAVDLHLEQYIIKPVNLDTMVEALKKCLKFRHLFSDTLLKIGDDYTYNEYTKELIYKNEPIKLNKKEIAFLELLFKHTNRVVHYEEIQEYVWGDDFMSEGALRSLVRNIRKKLPIDYIANLSGIGYRWNV